MRLDENLYAPQTNCKDKHWIISKNQIVSRIVRLKLKSIPPKILITTENHPLNSEGYHDPSYVLTLSEEAADYLTSIDGFHLYGTSWKSSDYCPGSNDRPIHNKLFSKGLILENLKLDHVPEGVYFMNAFPLPLHNASESPVVPVLFEYKELEISGS